MSAAAIKCTSVRRFSQFNYENQCNRCGQTVYSTEKIGPLKDFTFYHNGCFKCALCGTKLTLKTYYNNQQDQDDKEVYCQSHVPKTGPGKLDNSAVGIKAALNVPRKSELVNEQIRGSTGKPTMDAEALLIRHPLSHNYHISSYPPGLRSNSPQYPDGNIRPDPGHGVGHFDSSALHIQHAVNQTKLNHSMPLSPPNTGKNSDPQPTNGTNGTNGNTALLRHSVRPGIEGRINDFLDSELQKRLEMMHRDEEDALYRQFSRKRAEEEQHISSQIKEEWEKELEKLTSKFQHEMTLKRKKLNTDEERAMTLRLQKDKEDLEKNMTLKLGKKKESLTKKLLEIERQATAELVDKQSKEMMNLISEKMQEFTIRRKRKDHLINHEDGKKSPMSSNSSSGSVTSTSHSPQNAYPPSPPPPTIPAVSKLDIYHDPYVFADVDEIAINVAKEDQKTFTDLVRLLTENCLTDVEKARAIFRWITVKNLNQINFDDSVGADTPMGILRGIKHGTESYHVLFKRLCSYAGLHCVVIKGYSKSAGYQPGVHFEDRRFRNSWNAVYVAGSWRFVQCNWGARHLVNAKDASTTANGGGGGGQRSSSNGHRSSNGSTKPPSSSSSASSAQSDSLRYEYDDHYFLTDPKEFIYEFFPVQPEWQLLHCPISLREFEELPFVRSLFFRYGLYFVDEEIQATLKTDNSGAATVRIGVPTHMTPSLIFHYNLKLLDSSGALTSGGNCIPEAPAGIDMFDGVILKRFVMQSVSGNVVTFRVHAPCPGSFIMDIFANATTPREYVTGEPMKFKSVCKFKINCDQLRTVMVPLPDCASGEWGPLKAVRLFGLIPLTHEDALIFVNRDQAQIQFRMSRPLTDFMASLHRNGVDERKLSRYVSTSIDDDDNIVTFRIRFPDEGQYGLDIYTRKLNDTPVYRADKQLLTHCCKYLINVTFKSVRKS